MSEKSIALPITGMTCANCAANIERSLKKMEGIEKVAVNLLPKKQMCVTIQTRLP